MSNIPTLKGYTDGKQIHVWCPFCREWHHHGKEAVLPSIRDIE